MRKKSKSKLQIIISLIIIAILVIAGVFTYILKNNVKEEDDAEEESEEIVLDNRISPYNNQGLFVQILRIRNRGLMDKMLSFGTSWKNPPSFYYVVEVDGKKGQKFSYGDGAKLVFNEWDNFGKEHNIRYDIEEEQESSDVTIKIFEEIKLGLLKKKTNDVLKEEMHMVYDFYTGRWTGDDNFRDDDGMGHYLGENYEIWFDIYQPDLDYDAIPFWVETNILRTDPKEDDSKLDPDNDGIPTSWEWKWDYDPFIWNDHENLDPDVDGIENIEEYQMRKYLSNPYQPDIYIEADGMEKKHILDLPHIFYEEVQQMIIERFAQHGINVYIDDGWPDGPPNGGGEILSFHDIGIDYDNSDMMRVYNHNFADERKGIFRYCVFGAKDTGFTVSINFNNYDTIFVGNGYPSMKTRLSFTPRVIRVMVAKATLHEIGHTIGLMPWIFPGIDIQTGRIVDVYPSMPDDEYEKYVKNYYSVMNYYYIYNKPFFFSDETRSYLFDYSDGSNGPPYDMKDWEHIFLPTFQLHQPFYEEPVDQTFDDWKYIDKYQGVQLEGWLLDQNLTIKFSNQLTSLATVKNTDYDVKIHVKTESIENENNVRIYVKPNVEPVQVVWVLVAEGKLDPEGKIEFYSQKSVMESIGEIKDY